MERLGFGEVKVNMLLNFIKKNYTRDDVIEYADEEFVHHGAEKYSWQRKISRYIREQTDIYPPEDLQEKFYY